MKANKYILMVCVLCVCICILISANRTTGANVEAQTERYIFIADNQSSGIYIFDSVGRRLWFRQGPETHINLGTLDSPMYHEHTIEKFKVNKDGNIKKID